MNTKPGPVACFVCGGSPTPTSLTLGTHQKLTKGQRSFLLEGLLGFPKVIETRKNEARLCRPCIALLNKGWRINKEIQKLEERLEMEVRSVISDKYKNGDKGGQQPSSLPKSKVEQPQKKYKTASKRKILPSDSDPDWGGMKKIDSKLKCTESISFPSKNELNSDQPFMEGLIQSEDIKQEVDSSMESDTEQPADIYHSISDPLQENDYRCDAVDESDQAENVNFEETEKEEPEKKKLKNSRKRKSNLLTQERANSSDPLDSNADWKGMSEGDEENELIEETPVPGSSENSNSPIKAAPRELKGRTPKPTKPIYYKYDCPSPFCPNVKNYTYNDFAQHLRFHKMRPYRCKLCFEFISEDPNCLKDHLEKYHPEGGETPVEEIIIKEDIKSGNVFQCWAVHKCVGFPTEADRNEHERTCGSFRRKRRTTQWNQNQITCTICQKNFRNVNEWRFHRVLEHPEEDWMRCPFCDESFNEKTVEGVKERNDEKLFEHIIKAHRSANADACRQLKLYDNCEDCGLLFKGTIETVEHFRDKHGFIGEVKDWTYPCRICGKKLLHKSTLRRHMSLVHFRPEGTVCDLCGTKFNVQNTLIEHRFSQHQINEDNLPLISCPEQGCEFKCFFNTTMRSHCDQHKPKNKICEICGKGFKRGPDLNRHRATHSTSVNN